MLIASVVFLGGWNFPFGADAGLGLQLVLTLLKASALIFVIFWSRAVMPRLRIDQLMAFSWKVLLPFSIFQVMANAIILAYNGADWIIGLTSLALLVLLAGLVYGRARLQAGEAARRLRLRARAPAHDHRIRRERSRRGQRFLGGRRVTATEVVFYIIAFFMIAAGLGVVLFRNIVHAALALIMALAAVAGVYVILSVEFLALAQLVIYGAAVIMLVLFALMLTRSRERPQAVFGKNPPLRRGRGRRAAGGVHRRHRRDGVDAAGAGRY